MKQMLKFTKNYSLKSLHFKDSAYLFPVTSQLLNLTGNHIIYGKQQQHTKIK